MPRLNNEPTRRIIINSSGARKVEQRTYSDPQRLCLGYPLRKVQVRLVFAQEPMGMLELSTEMGIFRFRSPSKFGCTVLYAVTLSCICVWSNLKSVNSCPDGSCPTPLVLDKQYWHVCQLTMSRWSITLTLVVRNGGAVSSLSNREK